MHASTTLDGMGSMKSQFKRADSSGARFALIFGAAELAEGRVAVKPLRGEKAGCCTGPDASIAERCGRMGAMLRSNTDGSSGSFGALQSIASIHPDIG